MDLWLHCLSRIDPSTTTMEMEKLNISYQMKANQKIILYHIWNTKSNIHEKDESN
jgi:hypothetical protein